MGVFRVGHGTLYHSILGTHGANCRSGRKTPSNVGDVPIYGEFKYMSLKRCIMFNAIFGQQIKNRKTENRFEKTRIQSSTK